MSDELWSIAEREGWAHFLGDGADHWQRVILDSSDDVVLAADATTLMQNYSKALLAAECPEDAKVFSNNVPGQNNGAPRIYFFSPKAADIAKDVLRGFSPQSCRQPDVGALRKIRV